jgi:tetratricopeptide (TPR) repeat protein
VTQEFYLSVTPVRDGGYLVRTERVALGVPLAEELVSWSVDRWLSQAVQVMHDPLIELLRGNRSGTATSVAPTEPCDLVSLGQELYNALFQGTIRDSWMIAQGVAQNQKEILRLRLGLKDERLPLLPWEVLHDGARPLATGTDVVFSRYRSTFAQPPNASQWRTAAAKEQPLRILMVLAAPSDQEVLQLHQEAAHLQQELQRDGRASSGQSGSQAQKTSPLELTILDQPGREQLTQALEQGRYDILHYAGHSDLSAAGGDLYLVSNKTGLTEVLSGDDLAGLLVNNGVRMVVFNSCQGTFTATASSTSKPGGSPGNLSDALLKRGVPAVLAMAERIPDDVALTLSRLFYRNLKQRSPIDLGLSRARQGLLSSYGSDQLYWALPILYLHPEFDGYLQPPPTKAALAATEDIGFTDEADYYPDREPETAENIVLPSFDPAADMLGDLVYDDIADQDFDPDLDQDVDRATVLDLINQLNQPQTAGVPHGNRQVQDAADFNQLGQRLYATGDLTGAIAAYGDALKLAPDSAVVYGHLGEALEKYGSLPEALTAYKMALHYDPEDPHTRQNLERIVHGVMTPGSSNSSNPSNGTGVALATIQESALAHPSEPTPQNQIYSKSTLKGQSSSHGNPGSQAKTWAMIGTSVAVLGAVGLLAIRPNLNNSGTTPTPIATTSSSSSPGGDNANLVTIATQNFTQGELRKGQDAVEQLLDRGALAEAEGALATVPPGQLEIASISYMRGRVAWESVRRKSGNASLEDARRYWFTAAKNQPTNPTYQNAIGFALYTEGKTELAKEYWAKAATLATEQGGTNGSSNTEKTTAEAGQALVLAREGATKPDRLKQAIELRDRLLQTNSNGFTDKSLADDWRWSEAAIVDWKKLASLKKPA